MSANTGVAAVCNVQPQPQQFISTTPRVPSFSVPNVNDPASLVMAIIQLQLALTAITGPPPLNNTPNGPDEFTSSSKSNTVYSNTSSSEERHAAFKEHSRTTELVKVVNPNDSSQYVIIKRITKLQFKNAVTKQLIKWEYQNSRVTPTET